MSQTFTSLYVHLVWSVAGRQPLLTPDVARLVYRQLVSKCADLRSSAIAVGGVEDHVHVLVRLATTVSVATLAHDLKGSSSHFFNHILMPGSQFRWQGGYGAFSVSVRGVEAVTAYVRDQHRHHAEGSIAQALERTID